MQEAVSDLDQIAAEDSFRRIIKLGKDGLVPLPEWVCEIFESLLKKNIIKVNIILDEEAKTEGALTISHRVSREENVFIDINIHPSLITANTDNGFNTDDCLSQAIHETVDLAVDLRRAGARFPIELLA